MVNIVFIIKQQKILFNRLTSFTDSYVRMFLICIKTDTIKESYKHLRSLQHVLTCIKAKVNT